MNQIRKALVVGINRYPFFKNEAGESINLDLAEKDADDLANLLEKDGGFTTITRLPYSSSSTKGIFPEKILANSNIVRLEDLQNAIENLFNPQDQIKFPDVAFFYFSGHGWSDPQTQECFLLTSDSNPTKKLNLLPIRWLQKQLAKSSVKQQVVILDCCFSGGLFVDLNLAQTSEIDRCLITACLPSQIAQEQTKNSFLTQKLLEGLTLNEDRSFVTNRDIESWIKSLKFQNGQEPLCRNWGERTIVLTDREWRSLDSNECPYRSLDYFDVQDSHVFFGRSKLTDKLIEQVRHDRLIVVTGASGIGKSSLLRAGLLAQLQRGQKIRGSDQWYYFPPFTPGDLRLRSTHSNFAEYLNWITTEKKQELESFKEQRKVMLIDQFGECFTNLFDDSSRETFFVWLSQIIDENPELTVILGIRSDYRAMLQKIKLAEQIVKRIVNVGYLSREELEEVIIEPANKVGLKIDAELKGKLLNDVEDFPESLPLLQFTLTQLWNLSQKPPYPHRLFLQDYERVGKIEDTLNKRADEAYSALNQRQQKIAQRIFLELTQIGGNRNTRRKIRLQDLSNSYHSKEELREVAEKLAQAHLVNIDDEPKNPDNTIINLTHEALLDHWEKIKHWKDELEEPMLVERRLEYAADRWAENGRQAQDLLTFGQVRDARRYQKKYGYLGFLDGTAEEFIVDSKKRRYTEIGSGLAFIICLIMGICFQAWLANLRKDIAITNSELSDDPVKGLVSAIKFTDEIQKIRASNISKDIETDEVQPVLQNAINNAQEYARLKEQQDGYEDTIIDVALSEDGQTLVSADANGILKVWDLKTGKLRSTWKDYSKFKNKHTDGINDVVLSHDQQGKWLLSASLDRTVKIWDTQSGQLLDTLKHDDSVRDVVISRDGKTIVSASRDGIIKFWDWNGQKAHLRYERKRASKSIADIVMSANGKILASGGQDGKVNVWDVPSGQLLRFLSLNQSRITSVAIAQDGQTIIWGNQNKEVILWKTSFRKPKLLGEHQGTVSEIKISPNGKMLASAGDDAVIKIWDLRSEILKHTLVGHQASLNKILFSQDSQYLFSTGKDTTIRIWDTNSGRVRDILVGHTNAIEAIDYHLKSKTLVSAGGDRTVRLWKPDFQIPQYLISDRASIIPVLSTVNAVATSQNSSLVAVGGSDNQVWLWNPKSNKEPIPLLKKHKNSIYTLAFSPDGKTLVSGGGDQQILVWDVQKKAFKRSLGTNLDTINALAFHPTDNNILVSAGRDKKILLWDLKTGHFRLLGTNNDPISAIAINSDGTRLASGDRKGNIKLWNYPSKTFIRNLENKNTDNSITSLAFDPTQKNHLVGANTRGTLLLWDTETGNPQEITNLKSDDQPVGSIQTIAFSPNGQYLASAGNDKKIRLWKKDANNFQFERVIGKHQATVYSIAFTKNAEDQPILISGGDDAKVNSWSVEKQLPDLKPACERLQIHPIYNEIKNICQQIFTPKK